MKKLVAFLFCDKEDAFKKFFVDEILRESIRYRNIPVTFVEEDFNHICYEAGMGGVSKGKFGIRRARRVLIIKQLLLEEIPSELLFEEHTGNYCLLCEPLDLAVFLVPIKISKTLQIGTIIHYGEGFTKAIEKQRKKSKSVARIEF
jgi:hypothetical protein